MSRRLKMPRNGLKLMSQRVRPAWDNALARLHETRVQRAEKVREKTYQILVESLRAAASSQMYFACNPVFAPSCGEWLPICHILRRTGTRVPVRFAPSPGTESEELGGETAPTDTHALVSSESPSLGGSTRELYESR